MVGYYISNLIIQQQTDFFCLFLYSIFLNSRVIIRHTCRANIGTKKAGLMLATLLKYRLCHKCLLRNFEEYLFYKTPPDDCFSNEHEDPHRILEHNVQKKTTNITLWLALFILFFLFNIFSIICQFLLFLRYENTQKIKENKY